MLDDREAGDDVEVAVGNAVRVRLPCQKTSPGTRRFRVLSPGSPGPQEASRRSAAAATGLSAWRRVLKESVVKTPVRLRAGEGRIVAAGPEAELLAKPHIRSARLGDGGS